VRPRTDVDGRKGQNRDMFIERREYLIDHFRVSFQEGLAWQCGCREFGIAGACRHTREAAGMRDAQASIVRHVRSGDSGLRRHALRGA
jgi:hypothetical protein